MHKVLIVDDDEDLLEMVEMALTDQGFKVSTIGEGKLFFQAIEAFKPDIILLDVFLIDADGRELCHQLKSDSPYKHIPVALYSAGQISNSSIRDSKANIFIGKPFNIMQLGEKINNLLAIRSFGKFPKVFLDFIQPCLPLFSSLLLKEKNRPILL